MFRGDTNKAGRPRGSRNQVTTKVKEAFANLLEDNLETIQSDLDDLNARDRLKILLELSRYVIPQLKSQEVKDVTETASLQWLQELDQYSEEELLKHITENE